MANDPSQCDRILALLSDGKELTFWELSGWTGSFDGHPRIVELRERGYDIRVIRLPHPNGIRYSYKLFPPSRGEGPHPSREGPPGSQPGRRGTSDESRTRAERRGPSPVDGEQLKLGAVA